MHVTQLGTASVVSCSPTAAILTMLEMIGIGLYMVCPLDPLQTCNQLLHSLVDLVPSGTALIKMQPMSAPGTATSQFADATQFAACMALMASLAKVFTIRTW